MNEREYFDALLRREPESEKSSIFTVVSKLSDLILRLTERIEFLEYRVKALEDHTNVPDEPQW